MKKSTNYHIESAVAKFLCTAYHLIAKQGACRFCKIQIDRVTVTVAFDYRPDCVGNGYVKPEGKEDVALIAWTDVADGGLPYAVNGKEGFRKPNYAQLAKALLKQAERA